MPKKQRQTNRVDELLDELLGESPSREDILGESGLIQQLSKRLIERALAGELQHHLHREAQASEAVVLDGIQPSRSNSRNGYSQKTLQTQQGALELSIPRDRNSTFEPILVPKHQRYLPELDEKILAMYARGLSVRDISAQLEELYGAKLSPGFISEVTDSVNEEVKAWQNRPLEELYVIVYLDALYVNIKVSGRVSKRA